MIRASARKPVSERSRRSTSGLMSRTATLIARNEPPQMSARVIRAAYGRRRRLESDTGLPLVGGHAEIDDLVRQAPHCAFVVITRCPHQQHESVADGCTLLRSAFLPTHRAGGNPLRDYAQLVNLGSEVGLGADQRVDVAKPVVAVLQKLR